MRRQIWIGFIPYVFMVLGIPFVNSSRLVLGLPILALWILVWVLLTPVFLGLYDILAYAGRNGGEQP